MWPQQRPAKRGRKRLNTGMLAPTRGRTMELTGVGTRSEATTAERPVQRVVMRRVWAMPNKWTFGIPIIMELVKEYAKDGIGWADPFAGSSKFAEFRNDLNPENMQPNCMEAVEFLRLLPAGLNGVFFDPPYSLTQVSRSYQDIGLKFNGKENPTGGFPKCRDEIARIVRPGGHVLSFGWNTVGMGIKRGFVLVEVLIVSHGGNRNDTLCTVERKAHNAKLSTSQQRTEKL